MLLYLEQEVQATHQHFTIGMLLYILHGTALEGLPKTTTDTNFGYAHVKGITGKVL